MFYELLTEYKIGGRFLKILQNIYSSNDMYVKLDEGLTEPFRTTIGCKQGCNISSILFNLFIGRLPTVFDSQCHGVLLDDRLLNCLLWADDCVLISQSSEGLQRSIDKAVQFFNEQGLAINVKKTQCMIFNSRGRKAKEFSHLKFAANGQQLHIADEYVYLGLTFTPSRSSQVLRLRPPTSLVYRAYREMETMVASGKECWLGKVSTMKALLDIKDPNPNCTSSTTRV